MFKKILLAYDGSDCANHAADVAGELACKFDAQLVAIYALRPAPRLWATALREQALEQELNEAKLLMGAVVERLQETGVKVESQIVEGMEHEVVLKAARGHEMDLIVIGSHGMGDATSFLLGSVSDKVAHRALCPVLIVR